MKIIHSLMFFLIATTLLIGCNSEKIENKRTVKQLNNRIDSIQNEFQKIDIKSYKSILAEMNQTIMSTKEIADSVTDLSSDFVRFYGAYSGAAKVLSRAINKQMKGIESGLALSKKQLDDLYFDIKHDNIPKDSVRIYIKQEQDELLKLIAQVTTINKTLEKQKEAYYATKDKVKELLKEIN